jgi:hypothetical protein
MGNVGVVAGSVKPELALVTPAKMKSVYDKISPTNGAGIHGNFTNVFAGGEVSTIRVSSKVELVGSKTASSERPASAPQPIGSEMTDPVWLATIDRV